MFVKPNFKRYIAGIDDAVLAAGVTAAGAALGAGANAIGQANLNRKNRKFAKQQAEEQRAYSTEMWEKQNIWNKDMWEATNEYNSPTEQMKRMRDAGLNPLYYGLDGSSANGLEAAQPLGYEQAKSQPTVNPMSAAINGGTQVASMIKDLQLKDAQIDKLKEDTKGVGLDNEFKEKTMSARVEAERLHNDLTKEQVNNARQDLKNKEQELEKLIAETDNEVEKKAYIVAQTAVQNALKAKTDAETKSILELLPYEKMLKEAQTYAQKAAGAASYASAAINNGLLDAGYCDALVEQITKQSKYYDAMKHNADAMAAINKFKASIRNGTLFDTSETGMPKGKGQMFIEDVISGFFQFTATLSDALGGSGLSSVAGLAVGAALGSQGAPGKTTVSMSNAMGI